MVQDPSPLSALILPHLLPATVPCVFIAKQNPAASPLGIKEGQTETLNSPVRPNRADTVNSTAGLPPAVQMLPSVCGCVHGCTAEHSLCQHQSCCGCTANESPSRASLVLVIKG